MGLRLDQDVDFDIDNDLTKRFIDKYVKFTGAVYGRPTNPKSHYWWKGQLPKKQFVLSKELEKYYEKFRFRGKMKVFRRFWWKYPPKSTKFTNIHQNQLKPLKSIRIHQNL